MMSHKPQATTYITSQGREALATSTSISSSLILPEMPRARLAHWRFHRKCGVHLPTSQRTSRLALIFYSRCLHRFLTTNVQYCRVSINHCLQSLNATNHTIGTAAATAAAAAAAAATAATTIITTTSNNQHARFQVLEKS
jgi:hypothetical protein